uniref:L-type lectin-like domain-containing protein n=1 Tax=Chromera velia CCMP2878 TaxID=1169474 RepID=A0A0G4EXY6_9ALVE|eukprot:Cvel_14182.t1-p1 / transcript=Cvel_14182.t1 / gene=Cvel_14182 / organism=Chromera_velia_CCMP2878 / gene_product=Vesicular integral-membrane protein VIP36, putative / transcript_product=Vesicular integral-membrane protein VIP36, putative / location=Cvel_scaffold1000:5253-16872(+) / protein_length=1149 / sequence_SO=supercontig / SO=protein_coding / is_pseudo=false
MMSHSFQSPLTFDNTLENWDLGGATIPAQKYVILTPQVANRTGQFWHRDPVKTDNWEVEFEFEVTGPDYTKSEGFAFWYAYEPYKSTSDGLTPAEWDLFAYKRTFDGVGVFFSVYDENRRIQPKISFGVNDGKAQFVRVPTPQGVSYDFRNKREPLVFRMAVGPKGVIGQIRLASEKGQWVDVFRSKQRILPGGYVGFSASTGPDAGSPGKQGDRVTLHRMAMFNLDLHSAGEAAKISSEGVGSSDKNINQLLEAATKSQQQQVNQIKDLTQLLSDHIAEQAPREEFFYDKLNGLTDKTHRMVASVRELRKELEGHQQAAGGRAAGGGTHEAIKQMNEEISGLKSTFTKQSAQSQSTISSLHQRVSAMKGGGAGSSKQATLHAGRLGGNSRNVTLTDFNPSTSVRASGSTNALNAKTDERRERALRMAGVRSFLRRRSLKDLRPRLCTSIDGEEVEEEPQSAAAATQKTALQPGGAVAAKTLNLSEGGTFLDPAIKDGRWFLQSLPKFADKEETNTATSELCDMHLFSPPFSAAGVPFLQLHLTADADKNTVSVYLWGPVGLQINFSLWLGSPSDKLTTNHLFGSAPDGVAMPLGPLANATAESAKSLWGSSWGDAVPKRECAGVSDGWLLPAQSRLRLKGQTVRSEVNQTELTPSDLMTVLEGLNVGFSIHRVQQRGELKAPPVAFMLSDGGAPTSVELESAKEEGEEKGKEGGAGGAEKEEKKVEGTPIAVLAGRLQLDRDAEVGLKESLQKAVEGVRNETSKRCDTPAGSSAKRMEHVYMKREAAGKTNLCPIERAYDPLTDSVALTLEIVETDSVHGGASGGELDPSKSSLLIFASHTASALLERAVQIQGEGNEALLLPLGERPSEAEKQKVEMMKTAQSQQTKKKKGKGKDKSPAKAEEKKAAAGDGEEQEGGGEGGFLGAVGATEDSEEKKEEGGDDSKEKEEKTEKEKVEEEKKEVEKKEEEKKEDSKADEKSTGKEPEGEQGNDETEKKKEDDETSKTETAGGGGGGGFTAETLFGGGGGDGAEGEKSKETKNASPKAKSKAKAKAKSKAKDKEKDKDGKSPPSKPKSKAKAKAKKAPGIENYFGMGEEGADADASSKPKAEDGGAGEADASQSKDANEKKGEVDEKLEEAAGAVSEYFG